MGDPLSVASGVVALSGFALQASRSLYRTIEGFRNSKRAARELREEVQALSQTLETLEHVAAEYEVELSALKLPLLRCGAACKELSDRIEQCVKHSDGSRTSLRDWTRLQYLGEDITNYKNVLANYKATIDVALGGATL
jgi:chromosome segregation ATPase